MCIFSGPVEDVKSTKIFVAADQGGRAQYTAYEMEFSMPKLTRAQAVSGENPPGTAMILPVPWQAGEEIRLVDMSKSENFFSKLSDIIEGYRPRSRGLSLKGSGGAVDSFLEVFQIGSFEVSIAYSLEDISRVNPSAFTLGPNAAKTLSEHYSEGYAFIVCALAKSGHIHPIAYTSGLRASLFVPTRHDHGEQRGLPKWDHAIYTTATGKTSIGPLSSERLVAADVYGNRLKAVQDLKAEWEPLVGQVPELKPFFRNASLTRRVYSGYLTNSDLQIELAGELEPHSGWTGRR